tara:strand:+ start:1776 stop:1967 length:192 start_codon:yes stop_codon:yes gene_type:complete
MNYKTLLFFNLEMKQRVYGKGILRAFQLVIVPVHEGKRGGIVVPVFDPDYHILIDAEFRGHGK